MGTKTELVELITKACFAKSLGPFTIMQFNVLPDGIAQREYGGKLPRTALEFERRAARALHEVRKVTPDVICFQGLNHFDTYWEPHLAELGYDGVFMPRYHPKYPKPFNETPTEYAGRPADGC